MTLEMHKVLARLPYEEKLRRVAELIGFARAFHVTVNRAVVGGRRRPRIRKQQDQDTA